MKLRLILLLASLLCAGSATALLDDDPEVVYLRQLDEKLDLTVIDSRFPVYATKNGKRARGNLREGSKAEIIGFTDRALQIRGVRADGVGMAGWVSAKAFKLPTETFQEDLKELYAREQEVRKLIAAGELALGMRPSEIGQVLGEPTKRTSKRTKDGETTTWEFIDYEIVNHYATLIDPYTRLPYRQLTHTTREVKERIAVTFVDGAVTEIEESEEKSRRRPRIVTGPIIFPWL